MEIVLACDEEGGIAKQGVMPWPRLVEDMHHFKALTSGHCVIMGSTTWHDECTPSPLPGRLNVVVSTREIIGADRVIYGDLPKEIDDLDVGPIKKFVIGGADIVRQVLWKAQVLHITEVQGVYDCDTFVLKDFSPLFKRTETRTLAPNANYTRWEKQ